MSDTKSRVAETNEDEPYLYTIIEYTHPDPRYRSGGSVAVNFVDGHGLSRVGGVTIDV